MKILKGFRFSRIYKTVGILLFVMLLTFNSCQKAPVTAPQADIISLNVTADTTGLKADGQRMITLNAQIARGKIAANDAKNITFNISANLGTFAGSTGTTSNVVTAAADGTASTTVKVGVLPGTYYVSAQVTRASVVYKTPDIQVVLNPLSFSDKLSFTADNYQPVADGATVVNLTVATHFETAATIGLTTNLGTFLQASTPAATFALPLDSKGNGTTQFQVSNQVSPHVITALLGDGTTATITLNPKVSYPDLVVVEPSTLKTDTVGTPVTLNVFLKKTDATRKPSMLTRVTYVAYQLIAGVKTPVGRFTGVNAAVSGADGTVPAVNFYADTGGITETAPIFIDVSAPGSATTTLTTTVEIRYK